MVTSPSSWRARTSPTASVAGATATSRPFTIPAVAGGTLPCTSQSTAAAITSSTATPAASLTIGRRTPAVHTAATRVAA